MILKKVPGAEAVYMVYDAQDRLVLTQDGNLRGKSQWLVTLYDELNRPIKTGLWNSAQALSEHFSASASSTAYPFSTEPTSGWELLTETHYDNYEGIPAASGMNGTFTNTYYTDSYFIKTCNTAPDWAQEVTQSLAIKGLVTWSRVKVLSTASDYLYSVTI